MNCANSRKIISQLVEARLEQGISQAELARRLGIQRSGINSLESGTQNPTLDIILILSILVDTFFSRISLSMPPIPNSHNTACVLS